MKHFYFLVKIRKISLFRTKRASKFGCFIIYFPLIILLGGYIALVVVVVVI